MHEESIDHILLHCAKARTLWAMFFSLFEVQWVLPATVKAMLLGWDGSFVGKKRKEVWRAGPCVFFGRFGRQEAKLRLRKKCCQSKDLGVLFFFFYFLWSEMKLFIKDSPSILVDFIDWVGTR